MVFLSLPVACLLDLQLLWPEAAAQEKSTVTQAVATKATVPGEAAPEGMTLPEYNDEGALLRPVGFERWMVVGTSIGLSYSDGNVKNAEDPGQFHNVYMQPQAFDDYVRTGKFPEQTVFVVTNNPSKSRKGKDSLNRTGFFAAPSTGLEVAVRDTKRFPDGWAYFMFHDTEHKQAADTPSEETQPARMRPSETAHPRAACYDCHAEHGAVDNVFTQFYSVLSHAREQYAAEHLTGEGKR